MSFTPNPNDKVVSKVKPSSSGFTPNPNDKVIKTTTPVTPTTPTTPVSAPPKIVSPTIKTPSTPSNNEGFWDALTNIVATSPLNSWLTPSTILYKGAKMIFEETKKPSKSLVDTDTRINLNKISEQPYHSPFSPNMTLPEKTEEQKLDAATKFFTPAFDKNPSIEIATNKFFFPTKVNVTENKAALEEEGAAKAYNFIAATGTTYETDPEYGIPIRNSVPMDDVTLKKIRKDAYNFKQQKIVDFDNGLNVKMEKELRELSLKNKYDFYGGTVGMGAPLSPSSVGVGGQSLEELAILDKYKKLKQENLKTIEGQYKAFVDDYAAPPQFNNALLAKDILGIALPLKEKTVENIDANNKLAVANIDNTINIFNNDKNLYNTLVENGNKSQNIYDPNTEEVVSAAINSGQQAADIYNNNLNTVKPLQKITLDGLAYQGLVDQIGVINQTIKSTTAALAEFNKEDVSNLTPEGLKAHDIIGNGIKANLIKLQELKGTMVDWGVKNLAAYSEYQVRQDKVTEFGLKDQTAAVSGSLMEHFGNLPKDIYQITGKVGMTTGEGNKKFYTQPLTTGQKDKSTVPANLVIENLMNQKAYSDIRPQIKQDGVFVNIDKAEAIQLFDKETGKFVGFENMITPTAFFYQAGKTGLESTILGGVGGAIESGVANVGETLIGQTLKNQAASYAAKGGLYRAGDAVISTAITTAKIGNRITSMVLPTGVLYTNQMYTDFRNQGFDPEQSKNLTMLSVFFEGGFEAAFGNEIKLYNAMLGKTESAVLKKEAAVIFDKAIGARILEATGRPATIAELSLAKRLVIGTKSWLKNTAAPFAKQGIAVGLEESAEEEGTGLATALIIEPKQKEYNPSYVEKGFSAEDALTTMVTTMATMLPMMGTAGYHHIQHGRVEALQAKFEVGSAPLIHLQNLKNSFDLKQISKEDYEKAVVYVEQYASLKKGIDSAVENAPNLRSFTNTEKENIKLQIFSEQLKKSDIEKQIMVSLTNKQKAALAEQLSAIDDHIANLIENGTYTDIKQRNAAQLFQLDYLFNDKTIPLYNDPIKVGDVMNELEAQQAREIEPKIIAAYDQKINALADRFEEILKERHDAYKKEKGIVDEEVATEEVPQEDITAEEIITPETEEEVAPIVATEEFTIEAPLEVMPYEQISNDLDNATLENIEDFEKQIDDLVDSSLTSEELSKKKGELYNKLWDKQSDLSSPETTKERAATPTEEAPEQTPQDLIPSTRDSKADIEIGKVGNTEYEVKADGVEYKGKKLDNPKNLPHKQLITEDIERRKQEALSKLEITSPIGGGTQTFEILKKEIEKEFQNTRSMWKNSFNLSEEEIDEKVGANVEDFAKKQKLKYEKDYPILLIKRNMINPVDQIYQNFINFLNNLNVPIDIDKINAKYKEELDALEVKSTKTSTEDIEAKKDAIEKKRKELEQIIQLKRSIIPEITAVKSYNDSINKDVWASKEEAIEAMKAEMEEVSDWIDSMVDAGIDVQEIINKVANITQGKGKASGKLLTNQRLNLYNFIKSKSKGEITDSLLDIINSSEEEINAKYDAELATLEKPETKTVDQQIVDLRAQEQAEYESMTDPNDEVAKKEIYDRYDKLITPLLKSQEENKTTQTTTVDIEKEISTKKEELEKLEKEKQEKLNPLIEEKERIEKEIEELEKDSKGSLIESEELLKVKKQIADLRGETGDIPADKIPEFNILSKKLRFLQLSPAMQIQRAVDDFIEKNNLTDKEKRYLNSLIKASDSFSEVITQLQKLTSLEFVKNDFMNIIDLKNKSIQEIVNNNQNEIDEIANKNSKKAAKELGIEIEKQYSANELDGFVQRHGSKQTKFIWGLIKNIAEKLGVKTRFSLEGKTTVPKGYGGHYAQGKIDNRANLLQNPEQAARVIVHELVHGVTNYIIDAVKKNKLDVLNKLTKKQINAAKKLSNLLRELQSDNNTKDFYGAKNEDEILAELTHDGFVEALQNKKLNFVERFFDYILDILGIPTTAYDEALSILKDMLENPVNYISEGFVSVNSLYSKNETTKLQELKQKLEELNKKIDEVAKTFDTQIIKKQIELKALNSPFREVISQDRLEEIKDNRVEIEKSNELPEVDETPTPKEEQGKEVENLKNKGLTFKLGKGFTAVWDSKQGKFIYFKRVKKQDVEIDNFKQIVRLANLTSKIPGIAKTWYKDLLNSKQRQGVNTLILEYRNALQTLQGVEDYKTGEDFDTIESYLMRAIQGGKFKSIQLEGDVTDVNRKYWFSAKGKDLDEYITHDLMNPDIKHGLIQSGFKNYSARDVQSIITDLIMRYPRGITDADIEQENPSPFHTLRYITDDFIYEYGISLEDIFYDTDIEELKQLNLDEEIQNNLPGQQETTSDISEAEQIISEAEQVEQVEKLEAKAIEVVNNNNEIEQKRIIIGETNYNPLGSVVPYNNIDQNHFIYLRTQRALFKLRELQAKDPIEFAKKYFATVQKNTDKLLDENSINANLAPEKITNGVIVLITDEKGVPYLFDNDGNISNDGSPIFQNFNSSKRINEDDLKYKTNVLLTGEGLGAQYDSNSLKVKTVREILDNDPTKKITFTIDEITPTENGQKSSEKLIFSTNDLVSGQSQTLSQSTKTTQDKVKSISVQMYTVNVKNPFGVPVEYSARMPKISTISLKQTLQDLLDLTKTEGLPEELQSFSARRELLRSFMFVTLDSEYNKFLQGTKSAPLRYFAVSNNEVRVILRNQNLSLEEWYKSNDYKFLELNENKSFLGNFDFKMYNWDTQTNKFVATKEQSYKDFILSNITFGGKNITQKVSTIKLDRDVSFKPKEQATEQVKPIIPQESPLTEKPKDEGKKDFDALGDGLDDFTNVPLNRLKILPSRKISEKQESKAIEWFNKYQSKTGVSLKPMLDAVNDVAYAQWYRGAITLFKGSTSADLYHEAFHDFTQLYLTKKQKIALYNEVANTKEGQKILNTLKKDATDLEKYHALEELMAEDFRKYMLSDQKLILNERPQRNSIFRRMYNALKEFFTNQPSLETIYKNLANNNIKGQRDFSNAMFGTLNSDIKGLDEEQTQDVYRVIDSVIGDKFRKTGLSIAGFFKDENKLRAAYNSVHDSILKTYKELENTPENALSITNSEFLLANWNNVRLSHVQNSPLLRLSKEYFKINEDEFDEEKPEVKGSMYDDDSSRSVREKASAQLIYLIATQPAYLQVGDKQIPKPNAFLPYIQDVEDFNSLWNNVANILNGTLTYEQQYKKLQKEAETNLTFKDLVSSLPNPFQKLDGLTAQLRNQFIIMFSQPLIPMKIMNFRFQADGSLNVTANNATVSSINKIKEDWKYNLQSSKNPYATVNYLGRNELDIDKVLEDFVNIGIRPEETKIAFLNALGISFSPKTLRSEDFKTFLSDKYKLKRLYDSLKEIQTSKNDDTLDFRAREKASQPFYDATISFSSQGDQATLKELADIEVKNGDKYIGDNMLNANGDSTYGIRQYSQQSMMFAYLNDYELYPTYNDLINSPIGAVFDITKNPDADNIFLKALFNLKEGNNFGERYIDKKTNKPVQITLYNHNGLSITSFDELPEPGETTLSLSRFLKAVQDISPLLESGEKENLRYGDKVTANGILIPFKREGILPALNPHIPVDIKDFKNSYLPEQAYSIFKNRLFTTLKRTNDFFVNGTLQDATAFSTNVNKGDYFGILDGMLSEETKKILSQDIKDKELDISKLLKDNETIIRKDIADYMKELVEDYSKELSKNKLIDPSKFVSTFLLNTHGFETILKAYIANSYILNMEHISLFFQDIRFYTDKNNYKEPFKRFSKATSTGIRLVNDPQINAFLQGTDEELKHYNAVNGTNILERDKSLPKLSAIFNDIGYSENSPELKDLLDMLDKVFKNSSKEDLLNIRKAHIDMKPTDAMAFCTFDFYREVAIKSGNDEWSPEKNSLYKKIATEQKLTEEETKSAFLFFPPLKLRVVGYTQDKEGNVIPLDYKFAISPLLGSIVKGKGYEVIKDNMLRQQVSLGLFNSASKHSSIGVMKDNKLQQNALYNEDNTPNSGDWVLNPIQQDFIFEVVPSPKNYKEEATFSTQLRKLLFVNSFDNGIPIDYKGTKPFKTLTEAEKIKQSYVYYLDNTIANAIDDLVTLEKNTILNKIGATLNTKTDKYTFDDAKLSAFLEEELSKRNISKNALDTLKVIDGKFKYSLDSSLQRESLEQILLSIIDNKLKKQKSIGESLIQASSIGYENFNKAIKIKPEVKELFESNPELANSVYEALGFINSLPSTLPYKIGRIYNTKQKEIFAGIVNGEVYINKELIDKYSNKEILENQAPQLNTILKNLNVYDKLASLPKEQFIKFLVAHEQAHLDFEKEGKIFKTEAIEEAYVNAKALVELGILKLKSFDLSNTNEAVQRLKNYLPTREQYIEDAVNITAEKMDNADVYLESKGYESQSFKGSLWGKKLNVSSMDPFYFLQGKDGYPKNKEELREAITKDLARNFPKNLASKYWTKVLKALPDDEKALVSNWAYYNDIKYYTSDYGEPYFNFSEEPYSKWKKGELDSFGQPTEPYTRWDGFISRTISSTGVGSNYDLWAYNLFIKNKDKSSILDWYENLTPEKLDSNISNLARAMAFKSMVVASFEGGKTMSALSSGARNIQDLQKAYYEIKQRTELAPTQIQSKGEEITPEQKQQALQQYSQYLDTKQADVILPTDKIIWGHPAIGKSYAAKKVKMIDFDSYKLGINRKYNLYIAPGLSDTELRTDDKTREARENWRYESEENQALWNQFIRDSWQQAKKDAKEQGAILFASDLLVLREFGNEVDKALTMPDELFFERSKQRNNFIEGELGTKVWKENLNKAVENFKEKFGDEKVINTEKYLSDLFLGSKQDIEGFKKFVSKPSSKKVMVSSWKNVGGWDLPYYGYEGRTLPDGTKVTSAHKVKIALQGDFKKLLDLKDVKDLAKNPEVIKEAKAKGEGYLPEMVALNRLLKDEKWLDKDNNRRLVSIIGVRIPVQGHNSKEFMEVFEFLPTEAGPIVIVSPALVAKSGGDFDWDKVTSSFPSFEVNKEGKAFIYKKVEGLDNPKNNINNKKALNNIINDAMRKVLERTENIQQLLIPNSTHLLEPLADARKAALNNKKASWSDVASPQESLNQHESNSVGKQSLGILAVANTFFSQLQRAGAYMSKIFRKDLNNPKTRKINHRLSHNKTDNGNISLSSIMDALGLNRISDVFSQLINGAVDVAKKDWIFFINGIKEIIPNIAYLNMTGTPVLENIAFHTQPIINDFIETLKNYKSPLVKYTNRKAYNLAKIHAIYETIAKYADIPQTSTKLVPGQKIISKTDIDRFKEYVNKSNSKPKEFFTSDSKFTEFYQNDLGIQRGIPQSSKWFLNDKEYYDLIDQETGEFLIDNVDLATGIQYNEPAEINQPVSSTSALSHYIRDFKEIYEKVLEDPTMAPLFYGYMNNQMTALADKFIGYFEYEKFKDFAIPVDGKLKVPTTQEEKFAQVLYLVQFLEFESQQSTLSSVRTTMNQDTKKPINLQDSNERLLKQKEAQNHEILPKEVIKKLVTESTTKAFTSPTQGVDAFISKLLDKIFDVTDHPIFNQFLKDEFAKPHTYNPVKQDRQTKQFYLQTGYSNMPFNVRYDLKEAWIKAVKNDFIEYLAKNNLYLPNDPSTRVSDYFFTNLINYNIGLHVTLDTIKDKFPELLNNNLLLQYLEKDPSKIKVNGVPQYMNLKLKTERIEPVVEKVLIEAFKKLINFSDSNYSVDDQVLIRTFAQDLAYLAFNQSGLNSSKISFTKIIPQELYSEDLTNIIRSFKKLMDENPETAIKEFDTFYKLFKKNNSKFFRANDISELYPQQPENAPPILDINFAKETNRGKNYVTPEAIDLLSKREQALKLIQEKQTQHIKDITAQQVFTSDIAKDNPRNLYVYNSNTDNNNKYQNMSIKVDNNTDYPNTIHIPTYKSFDGNYTDADFSKIKVEIDAQIQNILSYIKQNNPTKVIFPQDILDRLNNAPKIKEYLQQQLNHYFDLSEKTPIFTGENIQNMPSKLEGQMTYSYGSNKREDITSTTTFDAILNGERTATTRYESDGKLDYWKSAKVGDIIKWESKDGRTVNVVVTKALHPLKGSGKTAEQWSKLEGWSKEYFDNKVRPKLDQAWQIEYKLATPTTELSTQTSTSVKNFSKKNLFTVTPQQGVSDNKAKAKASIATQYIGFGEGIIGRDGKRSTTQIYREQVGALANTGNYSANDVIFVSIPGLRGDAEIAKREQNKTIKEAIKALEAGATIITDNKDYIDSSAYNTGEQRLYKNMEAKGYSYSEITVDGQVLGIWENNNKPLIEEEDISQEQPESTNIFDEEVVPNKQLDLFSTQFDALKDFTKERKEEIVNNFKNKHKMSTEEALRDINKGLELDKEAMIQNLKDCY